MTVTTNANATPYSLTDHAWAYAVEVTVADLGFLPNSVATAWTKRARGTAETIVSVLAAVVAHFVTAYDSVTAYACRRAG